MDRQQELGQRLAEAPADQVRGADDADGRANASARAETQRGLGVLDRSFGLPGKQTEKAAVVPAAGKARIERQSTIHQTHHRADVVAEKREGTGGIYDGAGIVAARSKSSPGEIGTLTTIRLGILAPASDATLRMEVRS